MNRRQPFAASSFGGATTYQPAHAPNAALLIDFDNVTVGIRSDLGKELKALLGSDIIRGKVAVQRAYADWRRYPQYIVPLTESSVDLIFAPAYGTSKKNATDLRMAVDAIELVFTRPEIGTYILLTGDSDFSSCVLKLKEYGKYVIGVGMRESSSDLLIQNCDEYYSYHSLSGLTRATVGGAAMSEDPWELVREAVRQMQSNRDAMRPDRLKQVMVALDPGFDEKKLGYSKFSRFVQEAAKKGLIGLRRVGDGQYDIIPEEEDGAGPRREAAEPRVEERPRERDRDRDRHRGRGRDRDRDRDRGHRAPRPEPVAEMPPTEAVEAPAARAEEPEVVGVLEQVKGPEGPRETVPVTDIQGAYALLQHAVRSLAGRGGSVRDGEVKRKMLDLAPDFDEAGLGFSKFSRFLRQAHDAEAIDLHRVAENSYEVSLPASGKRLPTPQLRTGEEAPAAAAETEAQPAAATEAPARGGRGRGRRGGRPEGPAPVLPGQVPAAPAAEAAPAPAPAPRVEEAAPAAAAPADAHLPEAEPLGVDAVAAGAPAVGRVGVRGRRSSRGRAGVPEGPPPLLPGQTVPASTGVTEAPEITPPAVAAPEETPAAAEAAAPEEAAAPRKTRGRPRGRKRAETAAEAPAAEPTPAEPTPAPFSAEALGLPTDPEAINNYLTNSYKGVGKKTAEALTNAVGGDVFRVLEEEPARVREILGDRRAGTLLELWAEDRDRRMEDQRAEAPLPVPVEETPPAVAEDVVEEPARARGRGRRGGRGRGRKSGGNGAEGEAEAPEASAPAAAEAAAPAPDAGEPTESGELEASTAAKRARSRGRRGGRGRTRKKEGAAE